MRALSARWFLIIFSITLAGTGRAEEGCSLKLISSLDILDNGGGTPVVAVTFNGRPAKMILDTGAYWSGVVPSAAEGLKTRSLRYLGIGAVGAGGGVMRTAVMGASLQIGRLDWPKADFFIFARDNKEDPDLIGNIGANLLEHYDVEIDYPGRKVKFYLQDHCPGKVVSWPHGDLAEIPFKLNDFGHISLSVTLDGHEYRALLDTGATASYLDKKVADSDFGLTAETAHAMGTSDTLDGKDLPTFYHRFGLFDLGGLQFRNPELAFSTGQEEGSGRDQERLPSVILGMHQLRGLHLYIAYGERKIYASVAEGRPPLDAIDREDIAQLSETAQKQVAAGDYAGADSTYVQALRIGPDEVWLHFARAFTHRQAGDLPAAIADLDAVVRLDPGSAEALSARCGLKIESHQFEAAFQDCQQALSLDSRRREARLNRAYLYLRREQLDEAAADCEAVLAEDPQSPPALAYLGQIRQERVAKTPKVAKSKG